MTNENSHTMPSYITVTESNVLFRFYTNDRQLLKSETYYGGTALPNIPVPLPP